MVDNYSCTSEQVFINLAIANRWASSTFEKRSVQDNSGTILGLGVVKISALPTQEMLESILNYKEQVDRVTLDDDVDTVWHQVLDINRSDYSNLMRAKDSLIEIPLLGQLVNDLLLKKIHRENFIVRGSPYLAVMREREDASTAYSFHMPPNSYLFPIELGGAPLPNATQRVIKVIINYGRWHDTRNKRLYGIEVWDQGIWPRRLDKPLKK